MEVSYTYGKQRKRLPFKKKRLPLRYTKKSRLGKFFKKLSVIGIVLLLCGAIGVVGLMGWFSRDLPDPNKLLSRAIPLSTRIYDRTGEHLLYEIHGDQQRTLVALNEIPDSLKWATITTEDRNFYSHKGFALKSIFRSILVDIFKGGKAQGGSTITQQFIKNSLLTRKKTFTRKLKELFLAYQIEKKFTKDQILQMYFNEIPYGSTAYGAQSAARLYFNKDVKNITLAESALLAALPQAPTYYSPWGNNRDRLFARQARILDDMVSEGYISSEEAEDAKKEKIVFKKSGQSIIAPHFVMYVKDLLTNNYGEKAVEQGGLSVITTLDYDKQMAAEEAIENGAKKNLSYRATNAALVSLDARTGEIVAMVGSKDYFDDEIDGNVNVVLRKRQPGSSFKPIAYAAAFARGYTPNTVLYDVKTNFDTSDKEYAPQNYTGKEYGPVTMKKALAGSLNIAAVKTLYLAGVRNVIEFAKNLNYTSLQDPDRYGLALVLGGGEVTLLEHASSYTAFAQDGRVVSPVAIVRVKDKDGTVLEENREHKGRNVFDPEIARQINDILSDNKNREYIFGARNHLVLSDRPVAAKTGTTNDFHDAWTIGYTPSLVTGVWVGNNDNAAMSKGADGSQIAAPIWNAYMRRALEKTPPEQFVKPLAVQIGKEVLDGVVGQEQKVKVDAMSGLLATDLTPPEQIEERVFQQHHTILMYIDKDNPRGPALEHPEQDPQFAGWEKGVRDWVVRNNIEEKKPPTEQDSLHTAENIPLVSILTPQENQTITQNLLTTTISTSAPRGVTRVEYRLDNQLIDTSFIPPYTLQYFLSGVENGFHTLTVKSYDDVGNVGTASITLNFLPQRSLPSLQWSGVDVGKRYKKSEALPLSLSLHIPQEAGFSDLRKIVVAYTLQGQTTPTLLSTISDLSQKTFSLAWTPSEGGTYQLTAQLLDSRNVVVFQKRIVITTE
ncbi:PBP1A family penicillin-binding protein [Candidatus Uhrbacteria bacterium]|nr:PBP1A family penicillin-binding protein [Candidatus Uhrbacteria bacterium]